MFYGPSGANRPVLDTLRNSPQPVFTTVSNVLTVVGDRQPKQGRRGALGETVREREFSAPIQAVVDLLQPGLTVRDFRAPSQAWITRDHLRVVTLDHTDEAYTVARFGEELDPVARLNDPHSAADVINRLLRSGWAA